MARIGARGRALPRLRDRRQRSGVRFRGAPEGGCDPAAAGQPSQVNGSWGGKVVRESAPGNAGFPAPDPQVSAPGFAVGTTETRRTRRKTPKSDRGHPLRSRAGLSPPSPLISVSSEPPWLVMRGLGSNPEPLSALPDEFRPGTWPTPETGIPRDKRPPPRKDGDRSTKDVRRRYPSRRRSRGATGLPRASRCARAGTSRGSCLRASR